MKRLFAICLAFVLSSPVVAEEKRGITVYAQPLSTMLWASVSAGGRGFLGAWVPIGILLPAGDDAVSLEVALGGTHICPADAGCSDRTIFGVSGGWQFRTAPGFLDARAFVTPKISMVAATEAVPRFRQHAFEAVAGADVGFQIMSSRGLYLGAAVGASIGVGFGAPRTTTEDRAIDAGVFSMMFNSPFPLQRTGLVYELNLDFVRVGWTF